MGQIPRIPLYGFASKVTVTCDPECNEGSGVVGLGMLTGAQPQIPRRSAPRNDSVERSPPCIKGDFGGFPSQRNLQVCLNPFSRTSR